MTKQEIYDAIIVGSGATGGWAAKTLTEKGMRVLLLEAGSPLFKKNINYDISCQCVSPIQSLVLPCSHPVVEHGQNYLQKVRLVFVKNSFSLCKEFV